MTEYNDPFYRGFMRLRSFLQTNRLTHAEMAKRLGGVTGQAVRNWSLGYRMPEPLIAEKIVKVTKGRVTVQDLHDQRIETLKLTLA